MRSFTELTRDSIQHIENSSLELSDKVGSISVNSYTDEEIYRREVESIFRRHPIPFIPSVNIQNPGDSIAGDLCGTPLIAVRSHGGQSRVFLNVCRHRGAKLVYEKSSDKDGKWVCPFHGWTYSIDGTLNEIPDRKACFSNSAELAFRLKEVPSFESAGMIWVVLDTNKNDSIIKNNLKSLRNDLPEIGFVPTVPFRETSKLVHFNWKIGIEAFLEVYHFSHAHAPYLSDLQFPNLSLMDVDGNNCRILVPLSKPEGDEHVLDWAQVMYFIFPSTFLLFYDDHAALIKIVPKSIDQTEFRYIPLVPSKEDLKSPNILAKVEFLERIIDQDIAILEDVQKGMLASRANVQFVFTRLEGALIAFHENLKTELSV